MVDHPGKVVLLLPDDCRDRPESWQERFCGTVPDAGLPWRVFGAGGRILSVRGDRFCTGNCRSSPDGETSCDVRGVS